MLRFLSFGHSLDVSLPAYHSIYFLDCTLRSLRVVSSASVPFRSFVLRCPAFPAAVDTSISPLEPQSRFWGQTSHIPSTLSPKRDCGPKRVNRYLVPGTYFVYTAVFNRAIVAISAAYLLPGENVTTYVYGAITACNFY